MAKQSIEKCLAEYKDLELITFHANIQALFLCCNEDFRLLPLLMNIHFALEQRKSKSEKVRIYLAAVKDIVCATQ